MPSSKQQLYFSPASDLVIAYINPEMADVSNPRGEVYREAWKVVASNDYGDTWYIDVKSEPAAVRISQALTARMAAGKAPVRFWSWTEGRAVYGSEAYLDYGQADDLALEAEEDRR